MPFEAPRPPCIRGTDQLARKALFPTPTTILVVARPIKTNVRSPTRPRRRSLVSCLHGPLHTCRDPGPSSHFFPSCAVLCPSLPRSHARIILTSFIISLFPACRVNSPFRVPYLLTAVCTLISFHIDSFDFLLRFLDATLSVYRSSHLRDLSVLSFGTRVNTSSGRPLQPCSTRLCGTYAR